MTSVANSQIPAGWRRLAARRDVPVVCPCCGRSVRRKARQQVYCSTRCRKRAHRSETAVQPTKIVPRHSPSGSGTTPKKRLTASMACKGQKRGRAPRKTCCAK
jgi:hypothetical protein